MLIMKNDDQIVLWRHIRALLESHHRVAVSVDALKKLAEERGFLGRITQLEIEEAHKSAQIHAESLQVIDNIIRKLREG